MKSVFVLFVLVMTGVAAADVVVMGNGNSYTGIVTYISKDVLKVSLPDSTSKTLPTSSITCVQVASKARRESLLDQFSAAWQITGEIPPMPIVVTGAVEVGRQTPQPFAANAGYNVFAGAELRSASSTALWGIGLATAGSLVGGAIMLAGTKYLVAGAVTVEVTSVIALICQIVAWSKVGSAGTELGAD